MYSIHEMYLPVINMLHADRTFSCASTHDVGVSYMCLFSNGHTYLQACLDFFLLFGCTSNVVLLFRKGVHTFREHVALQVMYTACYV